MAIGEGMANSQSPIAGLAGALPPGRIFPATVPSDFPLLPDCIRVGSRFNHRSPTMKFTNTATLAFVPLLLATALLAAGATRKKEKGAAKPRRSDPAGAAIGENTATPISRIKVMKDFKVELLYSVPAAEQGSWVNLG